MTEIRFIPACAGNAHLRPAPAKPAPVHPRVCGERRSTATTTQPKCGSSPRVRGTLAVEPARYAPLRFIPACAGNAHPDLRRLPSEAVHPRVCGERHSAEPSIRH